MSSESRRTGAFGKEMNEEGVRGLMKGFDMVRVTVLGS